MHPYLLIVGVVIVFAFIMVLIFNRLTRQRVLVKEGWSGIATFLQQRADMIPNLVETVKGSALHESKTLADVVKWRNRAVSASNSKESIDAASGMNRALVDFFALAEQYPDLKANSNFMSLQQDLKDIENKLNQSRRYYNGTVRNYNQTVAVFPNNMVAQLFGFTAEPFFEEEQGAGDVPKVSFS